MKNILPVFLLTLLILLSASGCSSAKAINVSKHESLSNVAIIKHKGTVVIKSVTDLSNNQIVYQKSVNLQRDNSNYELMLKQGTYLFLFDYSSSVNKVAYYSAGRPVYDTTVTRSTSPIPKTFSVGSGKKYAISAIVGFDNIYIDINEELVTK